MRRVVLTAEIVVIILLVAWFVSSRTPVVTPLTSEAFVKMKSGGFFYYYEPAPHAEIPIFNPESKEDWIPEEVVYTINSESFNSTKEFSLVAPAHTYRIVTLGDSFTFGQFVNTTEAWPAVLADLLNENPPCPGTNYEVLNLGVPGYDAAYPPERFKLHGKQYDPDMVVWFLKDDDLEDYNEAIQIEAHKQKGLGKPDREAYDIALKQYVARYNNNGALPIHRTHVRALHEHFHKKLVVATYSFTAERHKDFLRDFALSAQQGYFFDGVRDIYREEPTMHYPDKHPNRLGHRTMAEDLYRFLQTSTSVCL